MNRRAAGDNVFFSAPTSKYSSVLRAFFTVRMLVDSEPFGEWRQCRVADLISACSQG